MGGCGRVRFVVKRKTEINLNNNLIVVGKVLNRKIKTVKSK